MRIAALYDIHGNLPALEAVLQAVYEAQVDQIVVGGDVIPGPMPRETLRRLLELDPPAQFIQGNCELAALAQMAAPALSSVTYWGTASGNPLPEPLQEIMGWTVQQLQPEYGPVIASWPKTLRFEVSGLGEVLFCHGTPQSETDLFTHLTPEAQLLPLFEALEAPVIVCGHTHIQFDRMIGRTRVVNAGSVGMPFRNQGAFWLLLGPEIQLQHTPYDLAQAAERIRAIPYPGNEALSRWTSATESLLDRLV